MIEQERADKAKVGENRLKERIFELEKDFEREKEKLFKVTSEMNKQYKQMQDELLKDINELKANVKKKTEMIGFLISFLIIPFLFIYFIEQKDVNIKQMTEDYEGRLSKKEDEITELKKKIDDMSNEFARMLRVDNFYKIIHINMYMLIYF